MNKQKKNKKFLNETHSELAQQWHPTKNGGLTPDDFTAGSNQTVWWKCSFGDDHEWEARICDRAKGSRCPYCLNYKLSKTNSLKVLHPDLAKKWHPTKNGSITSEMIIGAGCHKKYWWKCDKGHEWSASIKSHIRKDDTYRSCPKCMRTPLSITHPEIAKQWHPTKNGGLKSEDVRSGSGRRVWWKCDKGSDHEWEQKLVERTRGGTGCPCCAKKKLSVNNSLLYIYPELAKDWHPTKNGDLTPVQVIGGGKTKHWWKCERGSDHEWKACIQKRAKGQGCPVCRGLKVVPSNCLQTSHSEIAKEWHPTKNGTLTPKNIIAGNDQKIYWQCSYDKTHEWQATSKDRTKKESGCPYCNSGWTIEKIRLFVRSILPHLDSLTSAELYVFFQQQGILNLQGKGKAFIEALKTGAFPKEALEKFINGEKCLVDEIIAYGIAIDEEGCQDDISNCVIDPGEIDVAADLPVVETKDVLALLGSMIASNMDKEAIDFFIYSAIAKIWRHAFVDEESAKEQLETCKDDGLYSQEVKQGFLEQYYGAVNLVVPQGYHFYKDGNL